jgi:hypothetical protein
MLSHSVVARRFVAKSLAAKFSLAALFASFCLLPGCSINVKDKNNSKNGEARVDIKSPIGDLHVDEQPDIRDVGLTVYPGAKPAPKDSSEGKKSANVNLSVPGFALKVVAAEFLSEDAPDKVIAYYSKQLQHYGKPVECHGRWNGGDVGVDADKHDGLSKPVSCRADSSGDSVELKVGTEGNQHLVAIKPDGKGARFALVYVRTHTGSDDTI